MKDYFKKLFRKIKWDKKLFFTSFLWLGLLAIVVDFATKWMAELLLTEGKPVEVIHNFFYLSLSHNTGAAWSLGAGKLAGRIIFIFISLIMSLVFYFIWRGSVEKESKTMNAAYMLVWGGAVGNLIDRAIYFFPEGEGPYGVIDFLQFYLGGGPSASSGFLNPFPTFNVADACLVIGIAMIIVITIVRSIKENNKKNKESFEGISADNANSGNVAETKETESKNDVKDASINDENKNKIDDNSK